MCGFCLVFGSLLLSYLRSTREGTVEREREAKTYYIAHTFYLWFKGGVDEQAGFRFLQFLFFFSSFFFFVTRFYMYGVNYMVCPQHSQLSYSVSLLTFSDERATTTAASFFFSQLPHRGSFFFFFLLVFSSVPPKSVTALTHFVSR